MRVVFVDDETAVIKDWILGSSNEKKPAEYRAAHVTMVCEKNWELSCLDPARPSKCMLGEWFADFKVDATSIQASNFPIIVFRADSVAVVNISRSEEAKKERQETVELLPVPGKFEAHQEQSIAIAKMRLWFNIGNQGEYSEDGNFVLVGFRTVSQRNGHKNCRRFLTQSIFLSTSTDAFASSAKDPLNVVRRSRVIAWFSSLSL
mmetsp:Transcript_76873/g.154195  ORF Transcript_76873/g.154195 Transcript_76873/m.154195 type:complete len:205 (-) Transcript_76873:1122-1736(-)